MVTKWKGWTARRAVKIISFILFVALCIAIVACAVNVERHVNDTRVNPEIVFSKIASGEYFAQMHLQSAYYDAGVLAYYGSEASIRAGEHLKWFEYYDGIRLSTPEDNQTYVWIDTERDTQELRERYWDETIIQQAEEFRYALRSLAQMPGILYRIEFSDGTDTIYNTDSADFLKMPVYLVSHASNLTEFSHGISFNYYNRFNDYYSGVSISLAFTLEAVNAQNALYAAAKDVYVRNFAVIAICAILLVVQLVIMLLGAGRNVSDGGKDIHFAIIDRLPLDFGAGLIIGWMCLIVIAIENIGFSILRHGNYRAISLMCCAVAVLVVTPTLLWLLGLTKRMKAGKFWRHTLIYMILRGCARFVKSLWCGFPLTGKVVLIGIAAFFALLVTGFVGFTEDGFPVFVASLVFTAVTVFLLLRYARRLHMLDMSAFSVSEGEYDCDVRAGVGGGELGNIADSIMSISEGINRAVEQRMKSERLKTELITNVSHDIRTPLTSIITYTDLLQHEGLVSAKAPEYLDILIKKSQRLKTLTDELFEAAKAASGNIEVNITELDLVSLIEQVLGELDSAVKSSTLDLRVKLPDRALVHADGKLMWRVMENLMSNVFKYAMQGSRVYLSVEPDGALTRLELKNISASELGVDPSELTERFKRGDEARADGGNGLGLSIVQSFVNAQGGRFTVSIDGDLFKATVLLPEVVNRTFDSSRFTAFSDKA